MFKVVGRTGKALKNIANMTVFTLLAAAAGAGPAHAYIDPGMGSMILQGVIGGIAGGLFILKTYWAKLRALLPGGRKDGETPAKSDSMGA